MLDQITPVVLTYNEAPNLRRTLDALKWAGDIVVVDSHSDDTTMIIASQMPRVRALQRRFDCHQNQWNFALRETGIASEWVLALDADYLVTPELAEEIKALRPSERVHGYQARFVYCVNGKPLRVSAYPPVTVLYRRERAIYRQDGHTQRVVVDGEIGELKAPILHDDRKALTHWLRSQDRYMQLELANLKRAAATLEGLEAGKPELQKLTRRSLSVADRLRQTRVLFPFVIFFYCLFVKGGIRDGWAGVYYAFQRMLAETVLSLYLIEDGLKRESAGTLGCLEAGRPDREARPELGDG